jgi:hypothetical protein
MDEASRAMHGGKQRSGVVQHDVDSVGNITAQCPKGTWDNGTWLSPLQTCLTSSLPQQKHRFARAHHVTPQICTPAQGQAVL